MEFLFYINFSDNVETLVGGIQTVSFKSSNELVETEDFEKPYRILIPNSGVKKLDIAGQGVMDFENGPEMVQRLWDFHHNGDLFKATLRAEKAMEIVGNFFLKEFDVVSNTEDAVNFNYALESSGEFTMERLNENL